MDGDKITDWFCGLVGHLLEPHPVNLLSNVLVQQLRCGAPSVVLERKKIYYVKNYIGLVHPFIRRIVWLLVAQPMFFPLLIQMVNWKWAWLTISLITIGAVMFEFKTKH